MRFTSSRTTFGRVGSKSVLVTLMSGVQVPSTERTRRPTSVWPGVVRLVLTATKARPSAAIFMLLWSSAMELPEPASSNFQALGSSAGVPSTCTAK